MRTSIKVALSSMLALVVVPFIGAAQANASTAAPAAEAVQVVQVQAAAKASGHVTIPSNYRYAPNTTYQRTLHDYCTKSPDSFSGPGKNADFRGPCARHDMCIQYKQKKRSSCDADLLKNMKSECSYQYAWYNPQRAACSKTAEVYWAVVRVKTVFS